MTQAGDHPTDSVQLRPDTVRALRVGPELLAPVEPGGPLTGLSFVAKDLFDVRGWPTGGGNPDWLAKAVPAAAHAPAVTRLLEAGAALVGKSHTDELAYSLAGRNLHYGTPHNSAAPGRLPGGSSSGSAAAVAAGLADLGLGSDTGGSIRVPASYCGIFGLRPSHGRVPLSGAIALAPSFDTAGLLAPTAELLRRGMRVLLDRAHGSTGPIRRVVVADDAVAMLDGDAAGPWEESLERFHLPVVRTRLTEDGEGLDEWRSAFQALQATEAWKVQGAWIEGSHPALDPDVEQRFRAGMAVNAGVLERAQQLRDRVTQRLASLLEDGDALVIPSACGVAPPVDLTGPPMDDLRRRSLNLTCIAGLAGAPGLSLPLAQAGGLPLGVCLIGRPGDDEALLDLAVVTPPTATAPAAR